MIKLFLGILGVCVALLIVYLVRRDHLHVDRGLGWIIAAAGFAGLGFAPGIVDWIANRVGVAYPPILGVSLAIIVLAVKSLLMDIDRARLQTQNQRLTQRLAMLEGDIQRAAEAAEAHHGTRRTPTDSETNAGKSADSSVDTDQA